VELAETGCNDLVHVAGGTGGASTGERCGGNDRFRGYDGAAVHRCGCAAAGAGPAAASRRRRQRGEVREPSAVDVH
jgi:hypothetical protein